MWGFFFVFFTNWYIWLKDCKWTQCSSQAAGTSNLFSVNATFGATAQQQEFIYAFWAGRENICSKESYISDSIGMRSCHQNRIHGQLSIKFIGLLSKPTTLSSMCASFLWSGNWLDDAMQADKNIANVAQIQMTYKLVYMDNKDPRLIWAWILAVHEAAVNLRVLPLYMPRQWLATSIKASWQ